MTRHAVTGATSFTGRFIARRLEAAGDEVMNLTRVELDSAELLEAALRGVDTLYNTFWIRFERGPATYPWAIERSRGMFDGKWDTAGLFASPRACESLSKNAHVWRARSLSASY